MEVFLRFGSYILQPNVISFQNKITFICTNEAAIRKSWEVADRPSDINRSVRLRLLFATEQQ